jgi:hypothetical protein
MASLVAKYSCRQLPKRKVAALLSFWVQSSTSHYKHRFFESPPLADSQKTNVGVSSAEGTGNTNIGFFLRSGGFSPCGRSLKVRKEVSLIT